MELGHARGADRDGDGVVLLLRTEVRSGPDEWDPPVGEKRGGACLEERERGQWPRREGRWARGRKWARPNSAQ